MRILGIHDAFDAGAALVEDGQIRYAINEERLARVKNVHEERKKVCGLPLVTRSAFPHLSIRQILADSGLTLDDIDRVALPHAQPSDFFGSIPGRMWDSNPLALLRNAHTIAPLSCLYALNKKRLLESTLAELRELGIRNDQIDFVPHHRSHAEATYRTSGWNDALVIVADLEGDLTSTTVWRARGNDLELRHESFFPVASFGAFYGNVTAAIGFRKHVDECKVMGLAAYGQPTCYDELAREIVWDPRNRRITTPQPWKQQERLADLATRHSAKDIAHSAQKVLEERLVQFFKSWIKSTGCRRVCYSGGVAHNVIANQCLQQIPGIELSLFPHAGDGGLACGAALGAWYQNATRADGAPSVRLTNAYLGAEYGEERIEEALQKYGLDAEPTDDVAGRAAELLAEGKVCGLYQGRMELGPRALGHRSILSHPAGEDAKDRVNNKIKFRESWRPFALSLLEECQDEILEGAYPAAFMLLGFQVRPEQVENVRSAAHVDGSTRPQTVNPHESPFYHQLISRFRDITGVGGLLNTSLNRRGEPMCCTPEDAIECFLGSEMDALILGNRLLTKARVEPESLREFEAIEVDVPVGA